jgi:hypothetical protein
MFLRVQDDFIESDLFDTVREDATFFPEDMSGHDNIGEFLNEYHSEECDCYAPYMFWDGWWRSPANTNRKRVIEAIWSSPGLLPFPLQEVVGFEYWTRTFGVGQFLAPHCDEDTFLYAFEGQFRGPKIGCVWYGSSEATGGFLELHNSVVPEGKDQLERDVIDEHLSPIDERERIKYRPNRLVVFDAGHRLHETTKTTSGKRQVMVINVWHESQPPRALTSGEFFHE